MNAMLAALVNGMLVGAALALAVWIALRLMPRSSMNAATRYAVWWAALLAVVALPFAYLHTEGAGPAAAPIAVSPVVPAMNAEPVPIPREQLSIRAETDSGSTVRLRPALSRRVLPLKVSAGPWPARILLVWLLASVSMLIRLGASIVMLERRKAGSSDVPATLAARVTQWVAHCGGSNRRIRLASSGGISIPLVAGPWHPTILLPSRLVDQSSEYDVEQIGIHEAAHLVRRDDWALLIQRILEAVFALHPVVRWVSCRIDLEREIACDDFVIAATGNPRPYAACLACVVERAGGVRGLPIAAAAAEGRSHLAKRVEMLLDATRDTGTHVPGFRLAMIAVCIAAASWGAAQTRGVLAFAPPPATVRATVSPTPTLYEPIALLLPRAPLVAQALPLVAPPAFPTLAQAEPRNAPATPAARMVFVPVEVTDPQNRFVTRLDRDVFKLQEDGVEQTTTELLAEDSRTDIFMLVDPRLGPDAHRLDLYNVDFRSANAVVIPYDIEQGHLLDAVRRIGRGNARNAEDRGAILILTTSLANTNYTKDDLTGALRGLDMPVFSCELDSTVTPASQSALLTELAMQTGGRHIAVSSPADLPDALSKIVMTLRSMYFLGYVPSNAARDGAYRRLQVTLQQPRGLPTMTARSRPGYFAPAQ